MPAIFLKEPAPPRSASLFTICLLVLCLAGGCQPAPSPSAVEEMDATADSVPPLSDRPAAPTKPTDAAEPAGAAEQGRAVDDAAAPAPRFPWETWFAYFINDEHVGFSHLRAELISGSDEPRVRYRMQDRITVRRGSSQLVQQIEQESVEQWTGHPVRLQATVQVGTDTTAFRGQMHDGHFAVETTRGGEAAVQEIAWRDDFFGPHAVEQSLRDRPLQVNGRRTIHTLLPVQIAMGRNELHAVAREATELLGGEARELLKIENRLHVGENQQVTSYRWIDELGRTIKIAVPSLGLTGYLSNRALATAEVDPQQDLLAKTFVPLDRRIEDRQGLREAVYRLSLVPDATLQSLQLPELPGQQASRLPDGSLQVTVRAGSHALPAGNWHEPTAADLAPGPLVDHDAASVRELTQQVELNPSADARARAIELTGFVHQFVTRKDFSRAFAKASEVADEAGGDCTEHSVLLAALLRAHGIPARVAAGLVYLETADGPVMAYHMWTLAFDGQGWIALDATLGSGPAAADRITMLTSDLASGNEYECLMPVLTAMGQFKIEVRTP